ncbi:MAG: hypothetical protein CL927_00920 [Deltaproteobacteria bacterium]|nr:hypothetical protein [Deltaproteobacteria bacterium]
MKRAWPTLAIAATCIGACTDPTARNASARSSVLGPQATLPVLEPPCQRDAEGRYHPSLQSVLDAAEPGGTVFACDRSEGHPGPLVLRQDVSLVGPATVRGAAGPAIHVVGGRATLVAMTLVGGTGAVEPRLDGDTFGGVVAAWEADALAIRHSTIRDGEADWGGCIAGPRRGPLHLHDTDVSNCTARKVGGAIWIRAGTLEDSLVRDSLAPFGGGVAVRSVDVTDGDVHLPGTEVVANHGSVQGGGMLITGPARVIGGTVRDNTSEQGAGVMIAEATGGWLHGTAIGNVASVGGGGVFISGGSATLRGVSIVENTTSGDALPDGRGVGGGIWVAGDSTTTAVLFDVTLEGNEASWGGGLMAAGSATWSDGPQVDMHGGMLHTHTAEDGAGAAVVGARLLLDHTTVTDNAATTGGGVILERSRLDVFGGTWSGNSPTDITSEAGTYDGPIEGELICDPSGCNAMP